MYMAILIAIFIPSKVQALSCDNRLIADYRELAGNINIYSTYRMENGEAVFDISIVNVPGGVYVVDSTTGKKYEHRNFTTQNELIISGYKENQRVKIDFYINTTGCFDQILATRYVVLPNYNEFSTDPVCVGAEEYSLCQRWGVVSLSHEDFVSMVNIYKEKKRQNQTVIDLRVAKTLKDKILDFIGEYYIYLVSGVVVIILILAALKTRATHKNEFNFKV